MRDEHRTGTGFGVVTPAAGEAQVTAAPRSERVMPVANLLDLVHDAARADFRGVLHDEGSQSWHGPRAGIGIRDRHRFRRRDRREERSRRREYILDLHTAGGRDRCDRRGIIVARALTLDSHCREVIHGKH